MFLSEKRILAIILHLTMQNDSTKFDILKIYSLK